MIENNGVVLVLSGPSGAGKSSLINKIVEDIGDYYFSISPTTLPIIEGEEKDVHYHFATKEEFEKDICKLFKTSKIEVYSTFDIQGNKLQNPTNIQDNWFSAQRDTLDSKMFLTFTSEELIHELLKEVKKYNK